MSLKIIFMGTPEFSVSCLKFIDRSPHDIISVVTAPDKAVGRGRKIMQSAVKEAALELNLPLLQPPNLKNSGFLKHLHSLKADLFVVVAFRMLPKAVWSMPDKGTINLHVSLLPNYRGAAPINWAIINRENKTGVTTFYINDKIDTGNILMQEEISIEERETAGSLSNKLNLIGKQLLLKTINGIEKNKTKSHPQQWEKSHSLAPKLTSENRRIDWNKTSETIEALIRGLSPYPLAWTVLNKDGVKLKTKIHSAIIDISTSKHKPGEISIKDKGLYVATKNGYLRLAELQIEGKKKLTDSSFLNGFKAKTAQFE